MVSTHLASHRGALLLHSLNFGKDPELLKRKHEFIVKNQTGVTVVREPGCVRCDCVACATRFLTTVHTHRKIAGQQFMIANCRDCNIYLFDHIGTISVDECENCRIFVGPCATSAFFRDCKDCSVIAAVQQLRTRDCKRINMLLFSSTAPIVESSSGMSFGRFSFNYTGMLGTPRVRC